MVSFLAFLPMSIWYLLLDLKTAFVLQLNSRPVSSYRWSLSSPYIYWSISHFCVERGREKGSCSHGSWSLQNSTSFPVSLVIEQSTKSGLLFTLRRIATADSYFLPFSCSYISRHLSQPESNLADWPLAAATARLRLYGSVSKPDRSNCTYLDHVKTFSAYLRRAHASFPI